MPLPSDLKTGLTAARLRQIVVLNETTGQFTWLINGRGRFQRVGRIAGSKDKRPYPVLTIEGRTYYTHRLIWLYTRGRWPRAEVDHKKGMRPGVPVSELREATRKQNARNQGPSKRNKLGLRGVVATKNGTFAAFYGLNGKCRYIGTFKTAELAARAYDDVVSKRYGEFARLNFPTPDGDQT